MKKWVFLLCVLVSLALPNRVYAQDPTPIPDDQVNAVARDLYCPVCENIPLDVCPTKACAQWRELIREKLALGWDKGQIETFFADQYGEKVLAVPRASGLNWMIYVLPPVFLLIGFVLVMSLLRRSRSIPPSDNTKSTVTQNVPSELLRRIEEDLKDEQS